MNTVAFCFGGRRENLQLQLPLIKDALKRDPELEYHLWELARNDEDREYIRSQSGDRIVVHEQFSGPNPWTRFSDVYKFYADARFRDTHFVKMDDDVVFLESARLSGLTETSRRNRAAVTSANVFNNGACSLLDPVLRTLHTDVSIPLLDAHKSVKFCLGSHNRFVDNWPHLVNQPERVTSCSNWLSINLISYDWEMGVRMARALGTRSPTRIAERTFRNGTRLGDEGFVNTVPRQVYSGLSACHLTFGPQRLSTQQLTNYRHRYAQIGADYLRTLQV